MNQKINNSEIKPQNEQSLGNETLINSDDDKALSTLFPGSAKMIDFISFNEIDLRVEEGDVERKYHLTYDVCPSPVCPCKKITIQLEPYSNDSNIENERPLSFEIDLASQTLTTEALSVTEKLFVEEIFSKLSESDYNVLRNLFTIRKISLSEVTPAHEITVDFSDFDIEDGKRCFYADVLPYDLPCLIDLDGKKLLIQDAYCIRPGCNCAEALLMVENSDKECEAILEWDYRKKKWGDCTSTSNLSVQTVKKALHEAYPDLSDKFRKRHQRLKEIYRHNRPESKKNPVVEQRPTAGRNDPCPCGSGKKYKKCCGRR